MAIIPDAAPEQTWPHSRSLHALRSFADRTAQIRAGDVLLFSTIRDEHVRLPYFLEYYRALGIGHFLIVDNGSTDGGAEYLVQQPDVSLWPTEASYRQARFGVDWLDWRKGRYGHGHWTLVVDPDEFLVHPSCDTRLIRALTDWLDGCNTRPFGAMLLDMYPKGPMDAVPYRRGQDPLEIAHWFDPGSYTIDRNPRCGNLSIQGGPRARVYFADTPRRAPALNKTPLVRWHRRYAYDSSTHTLLRPCRSLFLAQLEPGRELFPDPRPASLPTAREPVADAVEIRPSGQAACLLRRSPAAPAALGLFRRAQDLAVGRAALRGLPDRSGGSHDAQGPRPRQDRPRLCQGGGAPAPRPAGPAHAEPVHLGGARTGEHVGRLLGVRGVRRSLRGFRPVAGAADGDARAWAPLRAGARRVRRCRDRHGRRPQRQRGLARLQQARLSHQPDLECAGRAAGVPDRAARCHRRYRVGHRPRAERAALGDLRGVGRVALAAGRRSGVCQAHAAFCHRILVPGPGCFNAIRRTLRKADGLPIPRDWPDAGYDRAAHRAAFAAFLGFLKANLAGQTSIRVDAHWASQAAVIEGMTQFAAPDMILREDEMAEGLALLARQAGHAAPPWRRRARPSRSATFTSPGSNGWPAPVYQRDYLQFGFGDWR